MDSLKKDRVACMFLISSEKKNCIKCTLGNWNGVLYRINRDNLDFFAKDGGHDVKKHLSQNGIYFLLGTDETSGIDYFYVGQAESRKGNTGLYKRICEHRKEEPYWNEVIAITTTDNSLESNSLHFLENIFYKFCKEANRCVVKNDNEPHLGNYSEENKCLFNEFADNIKVCLKALGYNIFDLQSEEKGIEFHLEKNNLEKNNGEVDAKAIYNSQGFVLLKGSHCATKEKEGCQPYTKEKRKMFEAIIKDGTLQEDIVFKTPLGAACFAYYGSINGRNEWKDSKGKSINEREIESMS